MTRRLAGVLFSATLLTGAAAAAPANVPPSGNAKGNLVVDGKPLALFYAVAISGPDTFDATKEALLILLTPDPIKMDGITAAKSFSDLRDLARKGLIMKYRQGENVHLTMRHAVLDGKELQTSGPPSMIKDATLTNRSVSGTLTPFMDDEKIFDHTVSYAIAFNAPIVKHLPLEVPIVLAGNARNLGPGGGDPGKAWLKEKCTPPPVIGKDPKSIEAYLRKEGLLKEYEDEAKKHGHTVTRADIDEIVKQFGAFAELGAALASKDCKVLGGKEDGKVAILQVQAFTLGSMGRTDITLVRENDAWKVKKEGTWSAIPDPKR